MSLAANLDVEFMAALALHQRGVEEALIEASAIFASPATHCDSAGRKGDQPWPTLISFQREAFWLVDLKLTQPLLPFLNFLPIYPTLSSPHSFSMGANLGMRWIGATVFNLELMALS